MSDANGGTGRDPLKNPRWERFAQFIAAKQDLAAAFEMAGFAPDRNNARKLAKRPEIEARIGYLARLKEGREDSPLFNAALPDATRAYVLHTLVENAEIAMGHRTVRQIVVKKGHGKSNLPVTLEIEATDRHGMTANKALEMIGKELGMWSDKPKEAPEDRENLDKRGVFDDERLIALFGPRPPTKDTVK